jgi:hypothetical protein
MTSHSSLRSSPSPSVPLSYPPCIVFALAYMYVKFTYPLSWATVNDNVYIAYSAAQFFRPAPER